MFPKTARAEADWAKDPHRTLVVWRSGDMVYRLNLNDFATNLPGIRQSGPSCRYGGVLKRTQRQHSLERAPAMAGMALHAVVRLRAALTWATPVSNPGYLPHDEMELMVAAGVPILKALQNATSERATLFGLWSFLGDCRGRYTDLLVLGQHSPQDIPNTRKFRW